MCNYNDKADDSMAINRTKFHFDNLYQDEYYSAGPYGIYQVGDVSCEPGYCVPPHCQVVNEISYIVSGNGIFSIDGKEYEVKKGTLFLNRKGEHHEIRSSKMNPLRYYYLGFIFTESMSKEEPVSKLKEFFENPTNRIVSNVSGIQEVFIKLFGELLTKDFLSANLIETYMHQILSYTYRSFSQKKYRTYLQEKDGDTNQKLIYDIVHYIDSEVENIGNLASLSTVFGYSYAHISHRFSEKMGESLKSYYTKRRFEKAKESLLCGLSVTQISEMLGYKSIFAFSRAFKKHFGMSPTDYSKWMSEFKNKSE